MLDSWDTTADSSSPKAGKVLKKKDFDAETEITIFDEVLVYLRGGHWQFRMYLPTEKKYVVKSLKTKNRAIAEAKGKDLYHDIRAEVRNGKKLFSMTTKDAVAAYLKHREAPRRSSLRVNACLFRALEKCFSVRSCSTGIHLCSVLS